MFKGGMASMMKKAQQMQENLKKAKAEIATLEATGSAAKGAITITLTGEYQVKNVQINASTLDDKALLEDLVLTAFNDASAQIKRTSDEKMQQATGGMNLPI
jgi:DNA-binding YbaB/EbfC family protein